MPRGRTLACLLPLLLAPVADGAAGADPSTDAFQRGRPAIRSMSVLEFAPDGTLLVGDSKAGAVWALALAGEEPRGEVEKPLRIRDIEGKLAARMGASPDEVLIHDLAVHPLSKNHFLAVSRGRQAWSSLYEMPNDVADATLLVRISPDGQIDDVPLDDVPFQRADLPNPVEPEKSHRWKTGVSLRADAITDLAWTEEGILVTGLSNEEFAASLWRLPYPLGRGTARATTLEIFHGAHGEYETHAPIRTFLPYTIGDRPHLLASYLCTPLVTFPLADLADGAHVRGTTLAEFGFGNAPIDMIEVRIGETPRILMSNSMLPLMTFDPADLGRHPAITSEVTAYTAGVPYTARAAAGIQQIDNYGDTLVALLQRAPNGRLDLTAMPVDRLR
ncbi:MAG: hypothetical protein R3325_10240 [Thermoanaerobaculia bacterium]|nr:hypothetical protein [Thermoanaerobaculia bacterium]